MSVSTSAASTLPPQPGSNSSRECFDDGRYHFDLGISEEMNRRMEELMIRLHQPDKAALINSAIAFVKLASDAAIEGKRVCVLDPNGEIEMEIEGLAG